MLGMTGLGGYGSFSPSALTDKIFAQRDTNQDGVLTPDEFTSVGQNLPTGSSSTAGTSLPDLFKQIDTDGDGTVSKDELTAYGQKLSDDLQNTMLQLQELFGGGPAQQASTSSQTSPIDSLFQAMDADGDGTVSKDELQSFVNGATAQVQSDASQAEALSGLSGAHHGHHGGHHHHAHTESSGQDGSQSGIASTIATPAASTDPSQTSGAISADSFMSLVASQSYGTTQSVGASQTSWLLNVSPA